MGKIKRMEGLFAKRNLVWSESKYRGELEKITDQLLEETIGPNGLISTTFQERLEGYDPQTNPISAQEAEALIHSLLRIAVAQRKTIVERIANSVEAGNLYQRYYSKVQVVSDSAVDAYMKLDQYEEAADELEYYNKVLEAVQKRALMKRTQVEKPKRREKKNKDIIAAIDEAGEGL